MPLACDSPVMPSASILARRYYDELARNFNNLDEFWANPYDVATLNIENELICAHLSSYERILDLGVGFYPHIESTCNKSLICLDISAESLKVAKRTYHKFNPRMQYIAADAFSLPFRSQSFDAVIAGGELINHVDGESLMDEISRITLTSAKVLLSVGMKWCVDSLYSLLDASLGNPIGYSMTRKEAATFVMHPAQSTDATWEVTPHANFRMKLYTRRDILRIVRCAGFRAVEVRSLNALSGVIPLPVQQSQASSRSVRALTTALLQVDKALAGRIPGLNWYAGNVYIILERR